MRKLYPYLIAFLTLISINIGYSQADNCASATNLSGTQLNGSCNNFNYSATAGDPFFLGTCGHNNATPYIWWRFTAQNSYLNVQFEPGFEVAIVNFGGPVCMDNGGAMTIITNCNNNLETNALVNGQEYYLMVTFNGSNPGNTCMRVYNPGNIPANDNCNNAIVIPPATLSSDACPGGGTTFNFGTPTQDVVNFTCNAPQTNLNVWFSFVAQGPYVEIQGYPGMEFFIIDFSGADCVYDAGSTVVIGACGPGAPLEDYNLVTGQQYYVMATSTVPNLPTSFNLCIFNPVPPPNNDCEDVINLTPAMLNCMSGGTSYEFGYATTDIAIVPECGHDQFTPNIWFSFTARGSYARIRGVNGFQFFLVDFTGNICDAAGAFLIPTVECNDGTDVEFHNLEEGKEYYIMVASTAANPPANVNLCVFNPEFPDNDEPCDAIQLNNGDCHSGTTLSSYPEIAGGIPGANCGTTNNLDDVWYSIDLGNRDYGVNITLSNITGFNEDVIIAVYSEPDFGDCSQLQLTGDINVPADCYSPPQMQILHLYPGKRYYIRVTSTSANDHGSFTICANYIPIPEPCSYSDDCANVQIIDPVINIPYDPFEDCNGGMGSPLGFSGCFVGCNIGSTPDDPPVTSNCIQPGWRTTWYRFNTRNYDYTDIKLTKSDVNGILAMGIDLFDACSGASVLAGAFSQCLFSPEGETEVNLTLLQLTQNTDYYLAIGSPASQTGHFEICINIYDVPSGPDDECASGPPIITPDILPPYSPGDIVNFHVFIPPYDQTNTIQWLQAVIPVFGEGWAPPSFDYFNGPPSTHTTPNGNWDWYGPGQITYNYSTQSYQLYIDELGRPSICHFSDCPDGIGGCLTEGDRLPAGWYAYQDGAGPDCVPGSGDPNLGWGDGQGPWEFTFTLQARYFEGPNGCDATGFTDLGVSIYIMSDQQTGCWNPALGADACRADLPGKFEAQNKCCQAPEVNHDPAPICSEGNFSYNIVTTQDADGDVSISWSLTYPPQLQLLSGAAGGTGRSLNNSFLNQSGATLTATYMIRTINAAGCDGISQITVDILSELDVEVPDPPVLCPGSSVTLTPTVSGGSGSLSSYLWNPGGHTGPTYTVSPATTTSYTVLVRDSQGCEGEDQVTVRVAQDFTARIEDGPREFCVNDEFPDKYVTAAIPTSGEGPFSYNWGGGSFDLAAPPRTINPLVSGTYIVTITDTHGCQKTADVDITVHGLPYLEILSDDTFCENEEAFDFQFISQGNGGVAPVKLIQNDYYINPVLFVVDPPFISEYYGLGTYFVTLEATDPETGCINTIDYELTIEGVPDILFEMEPVCFGTPVISLADAIFPFNGTFTSDVLPPDILFPYGAVNSAELEPGEYEFYYEVDDGVCVALDTFSFEITEGPELFLDSPNSLVLDCNVQSHNVGILNPGSSNDYTWYHIETGTTTQMREITITEPGTYVATFEDNAGCLARDTIQVLDDTTGPELAVDEPLIRIVCGDELDGQILVTVDGEENVNGAGFDFAWTVIDGAGMIQGDANIGEYTGEGTYRLTVLNLGNGCSEFIDVDVVVDTIAPDLIMDNSMAINCTTNLPIQLTANSQVTTLEFLWTADNGGVVDPEDVNNQTISVSEPGTYSVVIMNTENNCTTDGEIEIADIRTEPTLEVDADLIFNCFDNGTDTIFLSSDAVTPAFSWTASDPDMIEDVIGNNTIVINGGGSITFTVTDEENGCEESIVIDIENDTDAPSYSKDDDFTLDCQSGPAAQINIITDPDIEISWSNNGGSITSPTDQPTIDITGAGVYTFSLFNAANGCSSTDEVVVSENTDVPALDVSGDVVIDCLMELPVTLSSITDPNVTLEFTWTTVSGTIPAGQENQPEITIDEAGTYTVRVVNPENECFNERSIQVEDTREIPEAELEFDPVLNCYNESDFEIGITTGIPNGSIEWWFGGNPVPGSEDETSIVIGQGGTYTVILTNLDNNCQFEADIAITDDRNPPSVDAGGDQEILCSDNGEKQLFGSTNETNVSYLWTANPGNISSSSDPTSPNIIVEGSGTYILTVTNLDNGCSATDQAIVIPSTDIPQVEASQDVVIDCATTFPIVINAQTQIGGLNYIWTTANGGVVPAGQENQQQISVSEPGTYVVTVINPVNDCQNSDNVVISDIRETPTADIDFDNILNCNNLNNSEIIITTNVPNANFQWFHNGSPVGAGNGMNIWEVGSGGEYEVIITNLDNHCEQVFPVVITEDLAPPAVDAGGDQEITCPDNGSIQLIGSSTTPNVSYLWTANPGSITTDPPTQSTVTIGGPGNYTLTVTSNVNGCTSSEEIVVIASDDIPTVNAGADQEFLCSTTSLDLQATSDVGGGETYTWTRGGNPVGTGATVTVNQPGIYTVTVFNPANGCTNSDQVIVSDQRIDPDVNAGPDLIMECSDEGQKVIAGSSSTPGVTYHWSGGNILPPANQAQVTVLSPGTYTLTVTNPQNDCIATDVMQVTESTDIPPINAPDALSINCFQQAEGVIITASSPVSGIEYLWSSTESFQGDPTGTSITAFEPGTYNVSVINPENGCTNNKNITLVGDFDQPEVDAGLEGEIDCINNTTTLNGSSPNNVTYSWTAANNGNIISGAYTPTPTVNSAGTYILTVVDQDNGCSNQDQVMVISNDEYPHVGNLQDQILGCEEFSILTAVANSSTPGVEFSWTTVGGSILEGANTNMIVFDGVGTYTVEVLNPDNGCRSYASFEAEFTTDLPIANAGEDKEITCDEKTVVLEGSASSQGSLTYTWTEIQYGNVINNPNAPTISVDLTGTYVLTVRNNENGCSDTDQVIVFADDDVLSNVVLEERDVRCYGEGNGRVTITQFVGGVAPYRVMFNGTPVGTQTSFGPLLPGSYDFDIIDANGCELSRTVVIEEPDSLAVDIGQDTIIIKGDFVRTDPVIFGDLEGLTYVWDTSRVEFSNVAGSIILSPPHTIRLTLTITDPNGCKATADRLIIVERDPHIYVPNILVPNSSVNGRLTVDAGPEVKFIKSFAVFDRWGNFIYENKNFEPNTETIGWDGTFRGKPVQTGVFVYFLVAVMQDGSERLVEGDVTVVY